jgi:cellulose synthase/poly-beta-1,6-N-acetylglucosamine synthase-like glycosyltransferase
MLVPATLVFLLGLNLLVIPYFLFLLAISVGAMLTRQKPKPCQEPVSRFLVVVPAHNEESGIASTIHSCLAANYPKGLFDVVVIADNCSDRTAALAAALGARVLERFDSERKSKGFAIEFLIDSLMRSKELDALDALVLIDADTTADRDLLRHFDRGLRTGRDWIQSYYTVANPDESWRTRLMTYAFSLFNGVLLMGQTALGTSGAFRGNGMCLSTRGLRRRPWQSYGLVEDMEYSWALRIAGEKIAFESGASVQGAMPSSGGQAAANQRRRWEFGRSEIRKRYLGPVLRSKELGLWDKVVSACELTLPSMVGIAVAFFSLMACDAFAFLTPSAKASPILRGLLLACGLFMTTSLLAYGLSPFKAMRLPWRYLGSVALFPVYLRWKFLISARGRPKEWIRTERKKMSGDELAGCTDTVSSRRPT